MLKLVSNKDGVEIHQLEITESSCTITPEFAGVCELVNQCNGDKRQTLNALAQFNKNYVWAVTYETPPVPALSLASSYIRDKNLSRLNSLISETVCSYHE